MTQSQVIVEDDGPVCIITLNRPAKRNAVDRAMATTLREAFETFATDDHWAVAILTGTGAGAGDHFCAGADLTAMGDTDRRNAVDPEGIGSGPMGPTRMMLDKPLIAAVAGYAVAGGLELALWCDLCLIKDSAVFGVFCRRWGVPLIDGGTVRLPRIVGQSRALDMVLTGRPVDADETMQIGLAKPTGRRRTGAACRARAGSTDRGVPTALSAHRSPFDLQAMDHELPVALRDEGVVGYPVVFEEAISGAGRFACGAGRHGGFDTDKKSRGGGNDDNLC